MDFKRSLVIATLSLAAIATAGAASAETRWDARHPRQDQVLDRDAHLRHEIRTERREGRLSPAKAHRLLVKERQIAREDHAIARAEGGHITRREQHALNHQQTRVARRLPG